MINKLPALYARDSKGKILEWFVQVERYGDTCNILVSYGEIEGKKAVTIEKDIKGKNIGKTNETNSYQQALFQANSRIRKKKKEGYKSLEDLNINESDINERNIELLLNDRLPEFRTDNNNNIKPMKCQQYYKSKKNWTAPDGTLYDDRKYYYIMNPFVKKENGSIQTKFPAIIQPKINGVRALMSFDGDKVILRSKEGLIYDLPHITSKVIRFSEIFTLDEDINLVFDGELYIHGELLQDIVSAVKKTNLNTPRITFNIFDIALDGYDNIARHIILKNVKDRIGVFLDNIQFVTSDKVINDSEVQTYTDKFISLGYEGSIIREMKGMYGFGKRPSCITKLKRAISNDYLIIDVIPQEKDRTQGQYVCLTKDGERFEVNPKMTENDRRMLLINKTNIIGKKLQVFFYEYTDRRVPFHILNNLVRDYE